MPYLPPSFPMASDSRNIEQKRCLSMQKPKSGPFGPNRRSSVSQVPMNCRRGYDGAEIGEISARGVTASDGILFGCLDPPTSLLHVDGQLM